MKCRGEEEFKLSHVSIRGVPRCTSQLKTGIVFVSQHMIEAATLNEYDGLPLAAIQAKLTDSELGRQAHAFVITDTENYQIELEFMALGAADWWQGK